MMNFIVGEKRSHWNKAETIDEQVKHYKHCGDLTLMYTS